MSGPTQYEVGFMDAKAGRPRHSFANANHWAVLLYMNGYEEGLKHKEEPVNTEPPAAPTPKPHPPQWGSW